MAFHAPHPTFEVAQTSDRLGWGADIRVRYPPRPSNHCTMFPILNRYGSFPFKAHSATCAETRGTCHTTVNLFTLGPCSSCDGSAKRTPFRASITFLSHTVLIGPV